MLEMFTACIQAPVDTSRLHGKHFNSMTVNTIQNDGIKIHLRQYLFSDILIYLITSQS